MCEFFVGLASSGFPLLPHEQPHYCLANWFCKYLFFVNEAGKTLIVYFCSDFMNVEGIIIFFVCWLVFFHCIEFNTLQSVQLISKTITNTEYYCYCYYYSDKHFIFSTENISQCLYVSKTVIMKFHFHHYYTLFLCQSVQRSSNHFLQSLSFLSWMLSYVFKDICFIYGQINVKKQKVSGYKNLFYYNKWWQTNNF